MKPTMQQIIEAAEEYIGEYAVVAIRTQDVPFELGAVDHESHVWDDGDDTGVEIGGLSATTITSPNVSLHAIDGNSYGSYFGEYVAIICGKDYEMGDDIGEAVIADPVCVHIF